ncbi:MAG: hypothetical protein ACK5LK_01475, partial [Chthoniobacterales bacterium]
MQLIKKSPQRAADASRVAVFEDDTSDARVFNFAVRLREALVNADVRVLDRALTQGVVEEKSATEKGWRKDLTRGVFFGAENFVEILAQGDTGILRVVRSRDAALLGSREIAFDEADSIDKILVWLLPLLGHSSVVQIEPYLPTIATEALKPFYRGLALYDAGRYVDATTEFAQAYLINDKFSDALRWEANCYDALDLPQFASALRRFAKTRLVGNGVSGSAWTSPSEAVAFLGITEGPTALSASAASALTHTDREIRLPDDLARLSREYDWLAGLSEVEGVRWEQAPSFFCRLSLSGTAEMQDGVWTVVWTLTDNVSGKALVRKKQKFSKESKNWQKEMADFLPDFLVSEATLKPLPYVTQNESVDVLEKTLRQARGLDANAALLKLLLLDPENLLLRTKSFQRGQGKRDGLDAYLNFALCDTLIARLPAALPVRPWLELSRIYAFFETSPFGRAATDERPDVVSELEKFAEAHPSSSAALVARYSVLFERQDVWPYAKIIETAGKLLVDFRANSNLNTSIDRIVKMTASLHGGGCVLPWFQEYPGLQPFDKLKNIRFLVTAGEEDDYSLNIQNRLAQAEAFVTVLRGAGVSVDWKPFQSVGHFPTLEMEAASREFLSLEK